MRLRSGLSLEQIADRTKISIRFLRAIEAEEFDQLPGGIFTTSYLRQYAAAVGIEELRLLMYYETKTSRPEPEIEPAGHETGGSLLLRFWSAAAGR
jgi:cytoskeletal protein RodZ